MTDDAFKALPVDISHARGKNPLGTLFEVCSKRLLALNLRKLGGRDLHFAPRCYMLPWDNGAGSEFEDFVQDFKFSQALAILKCVSDPASGPGSACAPACAQSLTAADGPDSPEGLHGRDLPSVSWEPGPEPELGRVVSEADVAVACDVVRRAIATWGNGGGISSFAINAEEWATLRIACPGLGRPILAGAATGLVAEATKLLDTVPARFQMTLLKRNLWVLKPSTNGGGNGRGILLLDRLPVCPHELLARVVAVGRGGTAGAADAKDGCVLQKLVERPHLLDRSVLLRHWPLQRTVEEGGEADGNSQGADSSCDNLNREDSWAEAEANPAVMGPASHAPGKQERKWPYPGSLQVKCPCDHDTRSDSAQMELSSVQAENSALFKYNLRVWLLASFSDPPAMWLYKDSYVDLAGRAFTGRLEPESHITNLLRGDHTRGRGVFQRQWPVTDFAAYLCHMNQGRDVYHEAILPQVRAIVRATFWALRTAPSSLADAGVPRRLRRLGLDFLVDEECRVWLIEANILREKYGLKSARGPGGEVKRSLTQQLVEDEVALKAALRGQGSFPHTFEELPLGEDCKPGEAL